MSGDEFVKKPKRELDLVVYGATGDAGTAIAMCIANNIDKCFRNPNKRTKDRIFRWAIAGRTESKLNRLRSKIIVTRTPPSTCKDEITVLVADSSSQQDTDELAKSSNLIISAVGPYVALGETLYKACVENGTNYVDITGEVDWVLQMRTKYAQAAQESGSVMCSFSGYDCIPCEMTLYAAVQALTECDESSENDVTLSSAESVVEPIGGTAPRGTIRTCFLLLSRGPAFLMSLIRFVASERKNARWNTGLSLARLMLPRWSSEYGAFTIPHFMGWCNIPVVYNSQASLDCIYHDRMALPYSRDCRGTCYGLVQIVLLYSAILVITPLFLFTQTIFTLIPYTAHLSLRLFDSFQYRGATTGNQKRLEDSSVDIWTYATDSSNGSKARVHLHVNGDAGILCTAFLATQTAFAMLELDEKNELPRGVIGSPSMIVGDALIDRLQDKDRNGNLCNLSVTIIELDDEKDTSKTKKEN